MRRNKRENTSSYFPVKIGLDTRISEASTNGRQSKFSFFLCLLLCLLQHFLVKTEHEAEDERMLLSCIFLSTSQSTCSGFVRGFTEMAEAVGSLKKGFQKRCVSSLFLFMMVPLS